MDMSEILESSSSDEEDGAAAESDEEEDKQDEKQEEATVSFYDFSKSYGFKWSKMSLLPEFCSQTAYSL